MRRYSTELNGDAAAGSDARPACGKTDCTDAHSRETDTLRSGADRLANISNSTAALGSPQYFPRQGLPVALDRDVDIVLERERYHVLQRQVQIPRANQRLKPRRIGKIGGRHDAALEVKRLEQRPDSRW